MLSDRIVLFTKRAINDLLKEYRAIASERMTERRKEIMEEMRKIITTGIGEATIISDQRRRWHEYSPFVMIGELHVKSTSKATYVTSLIYDVRADKLRHVSECTYYRHG